MMLRANPAALCAVLSLLACPTFGASAGETSAVRDPWIEEVLLQLSEMRKSQGELAKRLDELSTEVAALRAGARQAMKPLDLNDAQFPSRGDAKAQVAIVEFSDFQCPYCHQHQQATLPGLDAKYLSTGKARYFFVDYPLSFHSHALEAAVVGACAHQQGAFWKMHDLLFENQSKLGPALYPKLAAAAGLDRGRFESCLQDPKIKRQISERTALGDAAGVQGTPAFLIGRLKDGILTDARALSGAQPLSRFEQVLDPYIAGS
jgi:protein-disulfide isomerase